MAARPAKRARVETSTTPANAAYRVLFYHMVTHETLLVKCLSRDTGSQLLALMDQLPASRHLDALRDATATSVPDATATFGVRITAHPLDDDAEENGLGVMQENDPLITKAVHMDMAAEVIDVEEEEEAGTERHYASCIRRLNVLLRDKKVVVLPDAWHWSCGKPYTKIECDMLYVL
jgi:hypothetical protein